MKDILITQMPQRGDAVLGNLSTKKIVFATRESMMNATLDTQKYEYIGYVVRRKGRKVMWAYGNLSSYPSKKWAERYSFKLTGYTLDGMARTGVLDIREASNSWASNVNYTVAYQASSVAELVTQLNAFFLDTTNPVFQTQDWYAEADGNNNITLHFAFTDYRQTYNAGSGGFTLTANFLPGAAALARIRRKHGGGGGEGVISSWWRALAYYRNDNGTSEYQGGRTSVQTSVKQTYCINLPTWLGKSTKNPGDFCANLRAVYGEGEAGWLRFMESMMPVCPTDYGNMGMRDGHERTQYLAAQTYVSHKRTAPTPTCPAAYYCANIETAILPKGTFHVPTTEEMHYLLDGVRYSAAGARNSDPINELQQHMNKAAIDNGSSFWCCLRYGASNAWYASGYLGIFHGYYFYSSFSVVPFSLYELP